MTERFPQNMMMRWESLAVTKINCFFHDVFLGPGTGFYYKFGQSTVLVTNWHVLSGIDPNTRATRDLRGYYPNRIEFALPLFDAKTKIVDCRGVSVSISDNAKTNWYQHASKAPIADVAFVDLSEVLPDFVDIAEKIVAFHAHVAVSADMKSITHAFPEVSSEVFILGFPRGLELQGAIPIWKRGTIASEPLFGIKDGMPVMMVDAATREGMSGSPALYYGKILKTLDGKLIRNGQDKDPWLIGVYAGREGITDDEHRMYLGRIWRRDVLDSLFANENKIRGLNPGSGAALKEFLSI